MSCLADDKIVYKLNFVKISTIYCYKRKHYTMRVFGQIKGIKQGDIFKDRATLAKVGVHPPVQAGISGSQNEGADSIVLSGGYEDDRDYGNIIIYTGAGGRDESSGKQIRDQELTRNNLALAKSKLDNLPVRVTRGASHKSKYSPAAGYRYAGLYKVVDYWCDIGSSGFKVWRYRLELFHGSYESDDGIVFDDEDKIHESKRKASLSNRIVRDKVLADKIKKLLELFEQGDFTGVLVQAEKSASKMPYWFDGQRIIANSLSALGGEYAKAADALVLELQQFLTRVPNIINLSYSDGTSFSDEQTLLWVNTQVLIGEPGDAEGQQIDEISEAFQEAQKLASSGKLTEGLKFLKSVPTRNVRDDFRIKLATAELVAQSGQAKVAIPLLERLITETKRISAIDWETDFTIKAYSILVQAYNKLEDDDAAQKQQQKMDAFDQLCWFDPTAVAE